VRSPRRWRSWWAAAAVAVAVTASGCGVSLQQLPKFGGVSGPTYQLRATFANVVNLPANAQVRTGSFPVGFVSGISVSNFKAHVTMLVQKKVKVPVGTTAQIRFDTPLGEDYVLLQPPSPLPPNPRYLASDALIPESQTNTAPSVEDMFGALGALLNGGGINQLQTIIDETNNAFNGNQRKIHALINSLNQTIGSFSAHAPAVDNTLAAIANLSVTLRQGTGQITSGIDALAPAVSVLANENGDINQLVNQVNQLAPVANSVLERSTAGTVSSLQALGPVLDQLTAVQGELGTALTAIDSFEKKTPAVIPGKYVQVALSGTVEIPPVPSDALPLQKVTVDPPDPNLSYKANGIATVIEGGLP
jgi:phospholipid/cholesterol/gamma-HCH transport system substrate-binding protein